MKLKLCQLDQFSTHPLKKKKLPRQCVCEHKSCDWQQDSSASHPTTILQCLAMRSVSLFLFVCAGERDRKRHLPPVWQLYERPHESWVMWLPSSHAPKLEMALKSGSVWVCVCTFVLYVSGWGDVCGKGGVASLSRRRSLSDYQCWPSYLKIVNKSNDALPNFCYRHHIPKSYQFLSNNCKPCTFTVWRDFWDHAATASLP